MPNPTPSQLDHSTVDKLQKLIRANIDAYNGLLDSAKAIADEEISALFRDLASERSSLASELQAHVTWNGEEAEEDGSVAAAVHRTWINLRSMISGGGPAAILAEAERGEDHIKAAYEEVLKETAGNPLNAVLLDQYRIIKAGHDRIRDLRDAYKHKS